MGGVARWLKLERRRVPDGSAIAKAIDYSLNHWTALRAIPARRRGADRQQPPRKPNAALGMGRQAWLFIGSELAGQRAAVVMSLLQSAKLNGRDPWAYLKDVLDAAAHAAEQPNRGTAAPSLAAGRLRSGRSTKRAVPTARPAVGPCRRSRR